jgi:hypothetical protein
VFGKSIECSILPFLNRVPPAKWNIEWSNSEDFGYLADIPVELTRLRSLARDDYRGAYPKKVDASATKL